MPSIGIGGPWLLPSWIVFSADKAVLLGKERQVGGGRYQCMGENISMDALCPDWTFPRCIVQIN